MTPPDSALPDSAPPDTPDSELRALARLAVPSVLSLLAYQLLAMVDTALLSRHSEQALGSSALAGIWVFNTIIVARGLHRGMDPLIAQAHGAGEPEVIARWLWRGLALSVAVSPPLMLAYQYAGDVLALLDQPAALLPDAARFCAVLAWGVPAILLSGALHACFQSTGNFRPITASVILGLPVKAAASWLLLYGAPQGLGGWPGLGPVGCIWGTVIAEYAMLLGMIALGWQELRRYPPAWAAPAHEFRATLHLAALGAPVGLQQGLEVWGFSFAGIMAGWLGPTAFAAHALCLNLASLTFMIPLGIGMAASTRVGNRVGAGLPWGRAAALAIGLGAAIMACSALVFRLAPGFPLSLFEPPPAVLAAALLALPVAGLFQLFDGVQGVSFGVLRGAGDLRLPALINVVGYYCLGLPLGYALAFRYGLGLPGVWYGLTAALIAVAALLLLRIRHIHRRGVTRIA